MLLVVLGHTMSGTVSEFSESLLFQVVWTLQMPLFIIISGYVTRYSRPLIDGAGLWNFIKKRTFAYLLPWVVWTIVVRGLIFGQTNFLNLKYLLWHMDSGYWFLVTIWTISMIFGISDLLCNKWFKGKLKNIGFHLVLVGVGIVALTAVGYVAGMEFFAIKLTLYYLPIYLIGYLYGQIQDWLLSKTNAKMIISCLIVAFFGLWLASINRFDFFSGEDGLMMIVARFLTSMFGCTAIIGLFISFYNGGGQALFHWSGVHSLEIYLTHYLFLKLVPAMNNPILASMEGMIVLFTNFGLTVLLSIMTVKVLQSNKVMNYLLYAKQD